VLINWVDEKEGGREKNQRGKKQKHPGGAKRCKKFNYGWKYGVRGHVERRRPKRKEKRGEGRGGVRRRKAGRVLYFFLAFFEGDFLGGPVEKRGGEKQSQGRNDIKEKKKEAERQQHKGPQRSTRKAHHKTTFFCVHNVEIKLRVEGRTTQHKRQARPKKRKILGDSAKRGKGRKRWGKHPPTPPVFIPPKTQTWGGGGRRPKRKLKAKRDGKKHPPKDRHEKPHQKEKPQTVPNPTAKTIGPNFSPRSDPHQGGKKNQACREKEEYNFLGGITKVKKRKTDKKKNTTKGKRKTTPVFFRVGPKKKKAKHEKKNQWGKGGEIRKKKKKAINFRRGSEPRGQEGGSKRATGGTGKKKIGCLG